MHQAYEYFFAINSVTLDTEKIDHPIPVDRQIVLSKFDLSTKT